MALGGLVLGSLILYLKGMRIMIFQLSGFDYILSQILSYVATFLNPCAKLLGPLAPQP